MQRNMTNIVDPQTDSYLDGLAALDHPVLAEMEALAAERDFPIVGPQVGRLLHLLTRLCGAARVLELGSGFGYSACWFARALAPGGRVTLTELDAANLALAQDFLGRAGLADRVELVQGDGLAVADALAADGEQVDIVFNDVEKEDYPRVPGAAAALLRPGGLLISDNVLWRGQVGRPEHDDEQTAGVRAMNSALRDDEGFESVWLPLRDGVSVSRRLPG